MNIQIAVATHKKYKMPTEEIYVPIQGGAAINQVDLGYIRDDTGENISNKNLTFCELTSLYWLWKNSNADYKGLVHYRRYFSKKKKNNMFLQGSFEDIADSITLQKILKDNDIIVPQKRNYYIETIESHYMHTHYEQDLALTREILYELYPEYTDYYEKILKRRSAHMFNMFIMESNYFNEYCEWLFSILFELERRLDITEYSAFHQRVYGRISEILLDVWLTKNKLEVKEVPVMFMEKQNWGHKVFNFCKAKFAKIKY